VQALKGLRAPGLGNHIERSWADVVEWNCQLYQGLAQFHASFEHADAYEYGHQVARLQYAVARLEEAAKGSQGDSLLRAFYQEQCAKVRHVERTAAKDNDNVYCERVPPFASLPAVVGKAIVKPQPWPLLEVVEVLGPGLAMATPRPGEDPFEGLVPMSVQRELQRCAEGAKRIGDAAAGRKGLDLEPLLGPRAVSPQEAFALPSRCLPSPPATFCDLPPPSTAFHHLPPPSTTFRP
jgi:hypothetical protein